MESELVSILIPVYNRVSLVGETIESAINQTYKNIEIIIVDNCSTDGTWNLLKEFSAKDNRIRIYKNEKNIGPVRNWQRCVDQAKGYYAKILFSDDTMESDWIEKTVNLFNLNSQIGFVFSRCNIINLSGNIIFKAYDIFNNNSIFSSKVFVELTYSGFNVPYSPGCFIFKREDIIGNLIVDLPKKNVDFNINGAGSDLLLVLLIANRYKKVAFLNSTSCSLLDHKGSFSNDLDSLKQYYNVARKYFLEINKKRYFYCRYKITRYLLKKYFRMFYVLN